MRKYWSCMLGCIADIRIMLIIVFILQATFADPSSLAWKNTQLANELSYVPVIASIMVDSYDSYKSTDKKRAFVMQSERTGINISAAYLVKTLIHRERPDMSDNMSFYSEHTALTAMGPRLAFTLPLTISTGYLRIAANKHYLTDVITGAIVGLATSRIK
jgi:hypothetical protein